MTDSARPVAPPVSSQADDALRGYRHLIVFDDPSPDAGGVQNVAYWLARTLAERGLPVVFAGHAPHLDAIRALPGIEVFAYRHPVRSKNTSDLRLLWLLWRLRRRYGSLVIFYAMMINNVKVFRWMRGVLGWRVASFLYGNETLRLWRRRPGTLRANVRACDVVFAISRYVRDVALRVDTFDNLAVVAPGIPVAAYAGDAGVRYREQHGWTDRKVVLILSRLARRKGHATLISAVATLTERHPDVLLAIAGSGGYREAIDEMVDAAGLRAHVTMLGVVPESDKPALYGACDVFCMVSEQDEAASDVEGFGIAFLEAAAAGRVAIGSDTGGIPDAIEDGASGFLVEPRNVEQLAAVLDNVLSDPQLRATMGGYARKRAATFDWSLQVAKMQDALAASDAG